MMFVVVKKVDLQGAKAGRVIVTVCHRKVHPAHAANHAELLGNDGVASHVLEHRRLRFAPESLVGKELLHVGGDDHAGRRPNDGVFARGEDRDPPLGIVGEREAQAHLVEVKALVGPVLEHVAERALARAAREEGRCGVLVLEEARDLRRVGDDRVIVLDEGNLAGGVPPLELCNGLGHRDLPDLVV